MKQHIFILANTFRIKAFICILKTLLLILCINIAAAQPVSQTFNSSGTYTVPAGYSAVVTIQAWGGGGGGVTGGGGGGAYATITGFTLPAGNYAVTVGTGGTGGTLAGTAGGASLFTTIVRAAGGAAGTTSASGAGGTIAASLGTTRFAGGSGAGPGFLTGGGGGGSALTNANGGNGSGTTGGAGTGNGGVGAFAAGGTGATPGGGGGGSFLTSGGSGGPGRVIVTVEIALPVTFGDISATIVGTDLKVNFTTLQEINNHHFDIEASNDGIHFTKRATINTKNQGGNATGVTAYTATIPLNNSGTLLGFSAFLIGGIAALGFRRKTKWAIGCIAILVFGGIVMVSCNKANNEVVNNTSEKIYVRIVQVDIDNTATYSKVVKAINE